MEQDGILFLIKWNKIPSCSTTHSNVQHRWLKLETLSVLESFVRIRSLVLWGVLIALGAQHAAAQARPVLLNPKRAFLAGRLVLIPASTHPDALGIPRQLAQIADHELRTPPTSLLADDQTAALNRWASEYDFAETDGLLVAADKLTPATLRSIRARHRHLSIFGFGSSAAAPSLLADGTLDFLLFTGQISTTIKLPVDRVGYLSSETNASGLLLARWLNQRFGFAPQFQLVFSSATGNALASSLARQVAALGGNVVTREASHVRVFIHTSQTSETERTAMVNALASLTANGVRVALVDVAENAKERAALLAALRERKLLDRLTAFASVNAQAPSAEAACQRALAQANLWIIALRFLRDDIERVRRIERNQIAASLSAYLRDAVYPTLALDVSGALAEHEARAQSALRPAAETLFIEQFKNNVHAVRLNTDERVEFVSRLLQRLQVRFGATANAPEIRPEIRVDVNLVLLGSLFIVRDFPRAEWELNNAASFDPRIIARFQSILWQTFKMDVNEATITIKLANKSTNDLATAQGYSLNSRKAGQTRRVTINAATAQGAFYALARLEHLGANGELARDFQFTEKPAVVERGYVEGTAWSHRERLELLRLAGRARLNVFVYTPRDDDAARVRELNEVAQENFVTLVKTADSLRLALQPCASEPLGAWSLTEPALPALNDKSSFIACAPASARIARLPLALAGAYGWSGKSLNAATALPSTLNWLYESKAREGLRPWLDTNVQTTFAALFDAQAAEINALLLTERLNQLQTTLPQFDTTREQGLLRGVLRAFLQDAQQRLSALAEDTRYERTASGVYRRRSP